MTDRHDPDRVGPPLRIGFVLEQTLGHVTHADNLARLVTADSRIDAELVPIPFELDGRWSRVPGHGNWTVRAGLRARRAVRELRRSGPVDALFVHTQVPATLIPDIIGRTPSVVSLDATPLQYDELGEHYGHATGGDRVERVKRRAHRACLDGADRLVAWSEWTKQGLVEDYGIEPDKVVVIAPGVDYDRWAAEGAAARPDSDNDSDGDVGPVRVLFVGGDLARKGGDTLVGSVRRLRADGLPVELDLVTHALLPPEPGIRGRSRRSRRSRQRQHDDERRRQRRPRRLASGRRRPAGHVADGPRGRRDQRGLDRHRRARPQQLAAAPRPEPGHAEQPHGQPRHDDHGRPATRRARSGSCCATRRSTRTPTRPRRRSSRCSRTSRTTPGATSRTSTSCGSSSLARR